MADDTYPVPKLSKNERFGINTDQEACYVADDVYELLATKYGNKIPGEILMEYTDIITLEVIAGQ